jgi:hypothetical protein|tara:strand:- start:6197 stop:6406 length:210 start_codon:yes stop_codon:yes gene_type:complete
MFKIFAMICMLNVGELDQTLCFKSEVPLNFNDNLECNLAKNNLADYLDTDLKERKLTVIFKCGNGGSNV